MADKNAKKEAVKKLGLDAAIVPWYKRVLYWGAGLAVVGAVGYFGWQATQKTEVVTFVTEDARVGDITVTVTADGTLKPLRTVSLGSELSGIVRKVNVDVNDPIQSGQTLIELDRANLLARVASGEAGLQSAKASLAQAEAQLNEAQVRYDRQLELHRLSGGRMPAKTDLETQKATVLTAKATVEVARASIADAEATLSTAKTDLSKAEIKSPIDGEVGLLDIVLGQSVSTGQKIGQINDLSDYKVEAQIDESYIDRVRAGLEATFDRQGTDYKVRLRKVYPEVRSGQFRADFTFLGDHPENIRSGQTYYLHLELGQPTEAVIIPRGSFYQTTGGAWIYVLAPEGDKAYKRPIRIGRQNPQYYEVLDGLEPGERVIVSGYENYGSNDVLILNK